MRRPLRNFFLSAVVDGRKSIVHASPKGKNGGMSICVSAINRNMSQTVVEITCDALGTGENQVLRVGIQIEGEDTVFVREYSPS